MSTPRPCRLAAWVIGVGLMVCGCSPTYRSDQVVQAIQQICEHDYHLKVTVRQIGHTIAVHLQHDGMLQPRGNEMRLSPSANDVLANLIEGLHRVILSTDATVNFYILLISDTTAPGAYITLIRYVDDVRLANANMLPPTEFFSRTIFDLKIMGVPGVGLDQLALNDIPLEQFLSWQLARRIQVRLAEALSHRGVFIADVGPCVGEFRNGEFAFTLNVISKPGAREHDALIQRVFQEATSVVAQVLADYRFKNFEAIRLVHLPTGRSLLLPKTRLELFR